MRVESSHKHPSASRKKHRPVAARKSEPIYAALDLGTNNCRLLLAEAVEQQAYPHFSLHIRDSFSRIVRLGEGVAETGALSEEAMERTIEALRICKNKLERYPVTHARFVATEACRRASNGKDFMKRVRREIGMKIDIISAEEEATLAFKGCASLLRPEPKQALVFDIGGGSTEFMWVKVKPLIEGKKAAVMPHRILNWFSLPYGVMNLSEKFGGSTFTEVYFEEMVEYLMDRLRQFEAHEGISEAIADGQLQLLSTSGTVTTLAAIYMGLPKYERAKVDGTTLSVSHVRQAIEAILEMRASERFNHPCIGSDRSDFILSGCAIFEAIARLWPEKKIRVADRGVREGIIMTLLSTALESQQA